MALRFNALTHVGGVNSIENFARSWTRAAGFAEVAPNRPSFIVREDPGLGVPSGLNAEYGRQDIEQGRSQRSLIRDHLSSVADSPEGPEEAIEDDNAGPDESEPLMRKESNRSRLGSELNSIRGRDSIFAIAPHLATPLAGSYGASYGTLQSTLSRSSMNRAGELWREQEAARLEGERQPILVKEIEQDGKKVYVIAGQSTLPQTIFNSTNVLIGVGLLSLPMGMKYAGWVCGAIFLFLAAVVTSYTARLLAKCMDADPHAITFADLALISYGQKARVATSVLFAMELLAACVALVVLFGDTLDLLIPGFGVNQWKVLCGLLLIPLNFVPLRLLSFSSVLGIFSCFCSKSTLTR
jgi:vesicular inhibitory amino acid transporter